MLNYLFIEIVLWSFCATSGSRWNYTINDFLRIIMHSSCNVVTVIETFPQTCLTSEYQRISNKLWGLIVQSQLQTKGPVWYSALVNGHDTVQYIMKLCFLHPRVLNFDDCPTEETRLPTCWSLEIRKSVPQLLLKLLHHLMRWRGERKSLETGPGSNQLW